MMLGLLATASAYLRLDSGTAGTRRTRLRWGATLAILLMAAGAAGNLRALSRVRGMLLPPFGTGCPGLAQGCPVSAEGISRPAAVPANDPPATLSFPATLHGCTRMSSATESDRLLVERVRRGDADAWRELIDRFEGPALGLRRSPPGAPQGGRGCRTGDVPGFPDQACRTTTPSAVGKLPVLDRRPQADRPIAPRTAAGRPFPWPPRPAAASAAAGPRAGCQLAFRSGERRGLEERALVAALASRSPGSASAAIGKSSPAWNCWSCAAGPTRTPPASSS